MRIDQAWLQEQRGFAPSDELFLAWCLDGRYRATAKEAAGSAVTCSQSMPWPREDDTTAIVDLLMREAAESFDKEHEAYASELESGDVVMLPDGERLEVTKHEHYEVITPGDRRFFCVTVWFDGADEPWEVDAAYHFRRFARPRYVTDLVEGDRVLFGDDEFVVEASEQEGDDVRVWFEGDPDDSPWEVDYQEITQVKVLPT